jgi:hypothetical protein
MSASIRERSVSTYLDDEGTADARRDFASERALRETVAGVPEVSEPGPGTVVVRLGGAISMFNVGRSAGGGGSETTSRVAGPWVAFCAPALKADAAAAL